MDWATILPVITLLLGYGASFLTQQYQRRRDREWEREKLEREREWLLENQGRQWKRERLTKFANQLEWAAAFFTKYYTISHAEIPSDGREEMKEEISKLVVQADIAFDYDLEFIFRTEWTKAVAPLFERGIKSEERATRWKEFYSVHLRLQKKILELVDETFYYEPQ